MSYGWHGHQENKIVFLSEAKGAPRSLATRRQDFVWSLRSFTRRVSEVGLMFYVYILYLRNNTYYLGFSSDLKTRIKAHTDGNVPQTSNLRPHQLVYYCAFISKKRALDFEKYLKTGSGFAFRNKHLT